MVAESIEKQKVDVIHRFTNHPPNGPENAKIMDDITEAYITIGTWLVTILPEGREKALVLTKLEEASMWSKASVARNQ